MKLGTFLKGARECGVGGRFSNCPVSAELYEVTELECMGTSLNSDFFVRAVISVSVSHAIIVPEIFFVKSAPIA